MPSTVTCLGIPLRDRDWVGDESGVFHAALRSEGEHHSAYCRKYVRGKLVRYGLFRGGKVCKKCRDRLVYPVPVAQKVVDPKAVQYGIEMGE